MQMTLFSEQHRQRRRERLEARNERIVKRFNQLYGEGYRLDNICKRMEPEFGLAPETIRKIVAGQR